MTLNLHGSRATAPIKLSQTIKTCVFLSILSAFSIALVGCGDDDDNSVYRDASNATANPNASVVSDAQLIDDPTITKHFTATELSKALQNANLEDAVANSPVCGITVHYMNHTTTGLQGEATNATGAVYTPTGDNPECQGERPVTLYAHGTNPNADYNLAALDDSENSAYSTALFVAAAYAGQGDIVIAPNYPGYDKSDLDYAPYVTRQQGTQMLDGLEAGKQVVAQLANEKSKTLSTVDTGNVAVGDKLFITGYSQGGYVALATAQALDDLGVSATAVSPGSGPYALTAFADSIMSGRSIYGGQVFLPMLTASYRAEYQSQYPNLVDNVFNERYKHASDLFPTTESIYRLIFGGQIPLSALFESTPTGYPSLVNISPPSPKYAFGFDDTFYLFNTDFRADYIQDMIAYPDAIYSSIADTANAISSDLPQSNFPIRATFIDNDLRGYEPTAPVLLCGGNQDPSVTFDVGSLAQAKIWQNNPNVNFAMIDVDLSNQSANQPTYISRLPAYLDATVKQIASEVQTRFTQNLQLQLGNEYQAAYAAAIAEGADDNEAVAAANQAQYGSLLSSYHGDVAPYCNQVANAFFEAYR